MNVVLQIFDDEQPHGYYDWDCIPRVDETILIPSESGSFEVTVEKVQYNIQRGHRGRVRAIVYCDRLYEPA